MSDAAPAAPTDAPEAPDVPTEPTPDDKPDTGLTAEELAKWKVEAEKWKALARKHERDSSSAAKELDEIRRQNMTEQERAVAEARDQGRSQAMLEVGSRLVDAEIRVAAAGRLDDSALTVLLQGVNRAAFLAEDGSVDAKSVRNFIDGIAPKSEPPPSPPGFPDLGQGTRTKSFAGGTSPLVKDMETLLGINNG